MRWVVAFIRFWYDFIVGEDWVIAVGIVASIALTAVVVDQGLDAWWLLPLAVIALLAGSLRRALRNGSDEAQAREPS